MGEVPSQFAERVTSLTTSGARERVRLLRGYDARAVTRESGIDTGDVTIVQQHFAAEVDINTIVRRFGLTRELPAGPAGGFFGDFTGVTDYESAVEAVERAREGFFALPAAERERFGNDPGRLVEYMSLRSEAELEAENVRLGLVVPPVVPAVVPPVAPPAGS